MRRFKIIGWYSHDGSNPHVQPFARVVDVEAQDTKEAYARGAVELDRLYEKSGTSVDFLGWFMDGGRPLPSA